MPNPVIVTVENPDELLDAGLYGAGAVIRFQSSATEGGAYADLSGTGSTPTKVIVTAVRSYTGFDPIGTVSTWYRTRYENVGATRVSDWTTAIQAGDETGGLLASVYDVEQELGETLSANDRENVLDKLRQVTVAIEGYTGRWFVPRPLSGTTTYTVHTAYGRSLYIPKGIRSITTLGIANYGQPDTGGVYSSATAANYYLEPVAMERTSGWPATRISLRKETASLFYAATFGAQITGAFGWASVPYDIQGVAIRATIRRYIGKGGGGTAVAVGPSGVEYLLPDMSGSDRAVLEFYRDRAGYVGS